MNRKYLFSVLLCPLLFWLAGCSSGSYNVKNLPDGSDSLNIVNRDSTDKPAPIKGKTFRVRTIPKFTLTVVGGINLGMSELSSNYADRFDALQFVDGQNFGVRNGYGVYAIGKIPLHKAGNVRLTISAAFNAFNNEFMGDVSPFGNVKYKVISFGAGLENNFSPKYRLRPYIGLMLTGNMISGDAVINTLDTNNVVTSTTNLKIKNSMRLGVNINTGIEYLISNNIGVDFGVRLSHNNIIFKSSPDDGTATEIPLRDKKLDDPLPFSGFKNFVYVAFTLGVNIYWGIKDVAFKF